MSGSSILVHISSQHETAMRSEGEAKFSIGELQLYGCLWARSCGFLQLGENGIRTRCLDRARRRINLGIGDLAVVNHHSPATVAIAHAS
jgi:hypothetical protein